MDNLVDKVILGLILYISQEDLSCFQYISETLMFVTYCFVWVYVRMRDLMKDR